VPRTLPLVLKCSPFVMAALLVSTAFASGPYQLGSANTVTADPNITRPTTTPCVVQLFSNAEFQDFNAYTFNYAPPADCPGPWAKVVFESDISVTAGIQYDRTANFWLGAQNIYFGTTAEPSPNLGPSWHIESDLTDYSSIFATAQAGAADIGNTLCCGLSGIIFASADIEFYPLAPGQTAPVTANVVLPLSAGSSGGTVTLNTSTDTLSGTFTLPTNIQNAYLDVYAQSQSGDEFWYTCVPSDVSSELFSCSNSGFRETEVTIDGQPAGVAPVYPWIFTGGIDPYLWFPLPGVQTLNFIPYRVDLTPFAGVLSNGQPHTVSLSVYNANNYFEATASLLLYEDAGSSQTTGKVTQDTLTAPNPVVTENLTNTTSGGVVGTVGITSNRSYVISGYVTTSHGQVNTQVSQSLKFSNNQHFVVNAASFVQNIGLTSTIATTTSTFTQGSPMVVKNQVMTFPLVMDISQIVQSNGDINQTTTANQFYTVNDKTMVGGQITSTSLLSNTGQHVDTLEFDSSFNFLGNTGQSSAQQYNYTDSTGATYNCSLNAANNVLTAISSGCPQ
jgi:Peptide N-acetyl-beta-D-glucosaminyl asparaginase amidase A